MSASLQGLSVKFDYISRNYHCEVQGHLNWFFTYFEIILYCVKFKKIPLLYHASLITPEFYNITYEIQVSAHEARFHTTGSTSTLYRLMIN